ncbi:uncharacterized protein V6R79_018332 [Siganus canaliculatus]
MICEYKRDKKATFVGGAKKAPSLSSSHLIISLEVQLARRWLDMKQKTLVQQRAKRTLPVHTLSRRIERRAPSITAQDTHCLQILSSTCSSGSSSSVEPTNHEVTSRAELGRAGPDQALVTEGLESGEKTFLSSAAENNEFRDWTHVGNRTLLEY